MSKRATQAELSARRKEIQELILQGVSSADIVEQMVTKWQTSNRAIREDMRYINAVWQETQPEEIQKNKNKNLERLEMLFNKALDKDQFKTALDIQREINKLQGLYNESDASEKELPKMIRVSKRQPVKIEDNGTERQH